MQNELFTVQYMKVTIATLLEWMAYGDFKIRKLK